MKLVSELRRRNVFRMAVLYVVAAWLIMQVAEVVIGLAGLPEWFGKAILALLAIGFPISLIFSWFYEITPEGLSLEKNVETAESITHVTGRRMDFIVIALLSAALILFAYDKWWVGPPLEKSIAVLPFVDMSPGGDQEHFSDGIAEELLNLLAKIPELKVVSRTTAFGFKDSDLEIREIADRLNVAYVLEGSVRKADEKIRITAQLIEGSSDTHIWSETWDRSLEDVFSIQDQIASEVVSHLKVQILGETPESEPTSPEAYSLYLQAQHLAAMATPDSMRSAIQLYQNALEVDPEYASAWNGLSRVYFNLAGRTLEWRDGLRLAREAAVQALSLDPNVAAVHRNLGWVAVFYEGNLEAAARHFQRAVALAPNDPSHLSDAAAMYQFLTRYDEAIAIREYLLKLDPAKASSHYNLGNALLYAGRWDDAVSAYQSALTLSPNMVDAWFNICVAKLMQGEAETALAALEKLPDKDSYLQIQTMALHALNREEAASEALHQLLDTDSVNLATVYAFRGDADSALDLLEAKYREDGKGEFYSIAGEPLLQNLHHDPRWMEFLSEVGRSPDQLAAIDFTVELPR